MLKYLKSGLLAATLAGSMFVVTGATAATVNVGYQGSTAFGSPNLSQRVRIYSNRSYSDVNAGAFRLTGSNGFGSFVAFCIDLAKSIRNGQSYDTSSASAFGGSVDSVIDRLFTSAYASVTTAVQGAAFQVALWEIITDTGTDYNLRRGGFRVGASRAVLNQANTYLDGLATAGTGGYQMTFLSSGSSQNLVTVTPISPVPVPAAAWMLGIGLLGLFGLRRRQKLA